jgi:hypothetical protein
MRELELANYKITDSVAWRLLAMGLAIVIVRIWELPWSDLNSSFAWGTTFILIASLIASRGLERKSTIALDKKVLRVATSIFGRIFKQRETDISNAAWVRARVVGSYQTQIAVEVGTIGYSTTELILLSSQSGKGIPEAEMLCARVAEKLNIHNKGFKGLA